MKPFLKRFVLPIGVILLIAIFSGLIYVGGGGKQNRAGKTQITVPRGASAWKTAFILHDAGLIKNTRRFVYHLKWRRKSSALLAGTYELENSSSIREISDKLINGEELMVDITIPEGWISTQIAAKLDSAQLCDSLSFMEAVYSSGIVETFGLKGTSLEGFLFPETYRFKLFQTGDSVVKTMVATFFERVGSDWKEKASEDKLGINGIVTLASIVQGEFQLEGETDDIAALYRNRLKRNMKLQADPTVQYVLPEGPRRLTLKDLRIDSPYNTYRYKGLPPGPINNPGIEALHSALDPPEKKWLFMCARGDGGHTFTVTFEDHLKAKKRLDAIRRQVARKKKQKNG